VSNLFINPQTREMLDPGEVTVRRIGDRQFYVESATGATVLPSSTPRPSTSNDPLTLSGTTGAQLPKPAPGQQRFRDAGKSRERSQGSLYGLLFTAFYHPLKGYGIIRSIMLIGFSLVITFIPLMLYTLAWLVFNLHTPTTLYLVIGICMFYLPMGLVTASVRDSISGIHPAKVLRGIFVAGPGYLLPLLLTCSFFITRYYAIDLAEATGNMAVGLCLINLFSFYLVATQAHMLGFLSHRLEEQLGWTNRGRRT
jgi:hypothetical protein